MLNSKKNKPFVKILILTFNGIQLLDEAIQSYIDNDYLNKKIIVIDNGSADGTQEYVKKRYPAVDLLRIDENKGYSGGLNVGLKYAFDKNNPADYVLITNNDVKADVNLISSLVEVAIKRNNVGFVIGKVYFYDYPELLQSVGKYHSDVFWSNGHIGNMETDKGQYDKVEERDWCDDIYWLVSSRLYYETGGYDTEFKFQAEDFDWQVRAKKKKFKIYYTPKAKLWHKDSITIGKFSAFKSYYDFRNPLIVHMKYREWNDYKFFLFRKIKMLIKITFLNLFKFRIYFILMSWCGFISAILWLLRNKILYNND